MKRRERRQFSIRRKVGPELDWDSTSILRRNLIDSKHILKNEIWTPISGWNETDTFVIPVPEFQLDGLEVSRNNSSFFLPNQLHFDVDFELKLCIRSVVLPWHSQMVLVAKWIRVKELLVRHRQSWIGRKEYFESL